VQPASNREEGARQLVDLLSDQIEYVRTELPDWQLRQVFIKWTDGWKDSQAGFYYAPEPVNGAPTTIVYRDDIGQWQISRDERTSVPDALPVLELADLRLAPESVAQSVEAHVSGIRVQGIGLGREGCDLAWHVGGFILDREGIPSEVVEGIVKDPSGDFQVTNRYGVPSAR
jgi:hypothetical protein